MIRVLTGATLIDGTGAAPVPDAAVVIDGDRVIAAGPRAATGWPADAEIVDVAGRTLIPGLIDAHDHMASHGYGLATRWGLDAPASTSHLRTGQVLAETLAMGYTTVRDAGGLDAGFKLAIEQGLIQGPRLVLGIQIISPTGGIGDRVSPSGHTCCAVYDPLLPNSVANGPDGVRDVVRTMVRAGADVIKTATTGGASSRPGHGPLDAAFSLGEMQALVTESHALGRRVMCHALGGAGLRALRAPRGQRAARSRAGRADRRRHGCRWPRAPEERAGAPVPGRRGPHPHAGAPLRHAVGGPVPRARERGRHDRERAAGRRGGGERQSARRREGAPGFHAHRAGAESRGHQRGSAELVAALGAACGWIGRVHSICRRKSR